MDGKWYQVPKVDQLKMTKLDGQEGICLLNLLLRPECQQKYDFNDFNKSQLLKMQYRRYTAIPRHLRNVGSNTGRSTRKHVS
ncbi:zinc finger MYND domain-containing protein 10-like [Polyodon spathula]|uniref:zinc finger MYND domain-containing protein 10-like n=1 Tax=Polyodon spathula TaxID=7913 RepID=UPI001B7DA787|nr:zinc finger MYND domain-containing protein 10-like [Polyodon spathula]